MDKYVEIELSPGCTVQVDKEEYDKFQAWHKFCSKNFLKPRDEQFYKEFLEYLKNK